MNKNIKITNTTVNGKPYNLKRNMTEAEKRLLCQSIIEDKLESLREVAVANHESVIIDSVRVMNSFKK